MSQPESRDEYLISHAPKPKDPRSVRRQRLLAARNPAYGRALAHQGARAIAQGRLAEAKAERIRQREAEEADARHRGQLQIAEAEARQQELERIAAVVAEYDRAAKEAEHQEPVYRRRTVRVPIYGMSGVPQRYETREIFEPIEKE